MLPEIYFLRYALPCARVLLDIRKTITQEDHEKIVDAVKKNIPLEREYLERIFPKPIEGMKKINPDYWNVDVIREYFWNVHAEEISKDLPPTIKRLCVLKKGKLVRQKGDYFVADLGEGDIRCVSVVYSNASVGDRVMVHYGYAVEKLD